MNDMDLDNILAIIGNPTRRSILRKLSREMHYPLQLSRELNISQQSVMKHLKVLEDNDLVMSIVQKSDAGPPRKYYVSTRRFSIMIDIAPSVFHEEIRVFEIVQEDTPEDVKKYGLGAKEIAEKKERLAQLSSGIGDVNNRIRDVENRRYALIKEKEDLMKEAYELLEMLCEGYEERKVLRYILEEDNISIARMSEVLNMREMDIENIMRKLEDLGLLELHRKIIYM